MDGLLFDTMEYTDQRIRAVMEGKTCRQCGHRQASRQGYEGRNVVQVCNAQKSNLTKSGLLRVRVNQPACILFTHKDNEK